MTPRTVLLACAALLLPGPATAQYQMVSPMLYEGPRISLESHAQSNAPRNSSVGAPAAQDPVAKVIDPNLFRYAVDDNRRRANLARFVAKTRATDPASAEQLARLFASTDIFGQMERAMTPYGLHVNNLADAYAIYWINAWSATEGHNDTPSRLRIDAVRAQAAEALAGTVLLHQAGDARRQELAEALWIQSALIDSAVEAAKGKPDALRAVGLAAAAGAKGMGLDPSTMTLTDKGFVRRP